jgi:hypothetical protein
MRNPLACEGDTFPAAAHIRSGQLVPLLTPHVTEYGTIYIYYGHRTEQPLRVKTFIDFMIAGMAHNRNFFLDPSELRPDQSLQRSRAARKRG